MFFLFKFARRIVSAALSVVVLVLLALAGYLYINAREINVTPTDAIVVLGAAQYDGTPTDVFRNRLDHAIDLYKLKLAPRIITVGGKQEGDRFTEAESGANYLIAHGIPRKSIVSVPTGSNTIQSLVAINQLMKKHEWTSITVSTDPLHAARVIVISNKLGLKAFPNPTITGAGTDLGGSRAITEMAGILWFFGWEQWSI